MIVGVGVDLTPIARFRGALDNHPERLEARLFTERERAYCNARAKPEEHFAARFAAKEAILKAMSVPKGLSWHELEVVKEDGLAPRFELSGRAKDAVDRLGVKGVHLSLSHAGDSAIAFVVLDA